MFYYQKKEGLDLKSTKKLGFLGDGVSLYREIFLEVRETKSLTMEQVQKLFAYANLVYAKMDSLPTLGFQTLINEHNEESDWFYNHSVNVFFLTMMFSMALKLNKNQNIFEKDKNGQINFISKNIYQNTKINEINEFSLN